MIVGDEGVSWLGPDGQALTVRYASCVGVVADPGPVRILYGADGFTVRVAAADWHDGQEAVRRIDASVRSGHRRDQPHRRLNRGDRGMRECAP